MRKLQYRGKRMLKQVILKEALIEGIVNGYRQDILLSAEPIVFLDRIREYLLTVNVAQSFLKRSEFNIRIRLEFPLVHFYRNAFLDYNSTINDDLSCDTILRSDEIYPDNRENKKIDIAILNIDNRSLHGIEIKGINIARALIISDIERLIGAIIKIDNVSENSINSSFVTFLKRFDSSNIVIDDQYVKEKNENELKYWKSVLKNYNSNYSNIILSIECFEIEKTTIENAYLPIEAEFEYSEVAERTGIVFGYMIIIERK